MTLEQVVDLWKKVWPSIVARAWLDDEFRDRLYREPNAILVEHQIPELRGVQAQVVSDEKITQATLLLSPGWKPTSAEDSKTPQVDWDRERLRTLMEIQVVEVAGTPSPVLLLPLPPKPAELTQAISISGGRPKHCGQTSSC